eukprot:TRINITY_DN1313_c0_g1_i2.p1 TRINITY_DN1313_c0_g1~~TRINITY_DN1313_c0_g1_i2.p1  ORF type:complete len:494 (-),score=176.18 TRINITY_DN1313_c0_g1_i2:370-1851(-)
MAQVSVDDDDDLLGDDVEIIDAEDAGPPPKPFESSEARSCFEKYDKDGSGSIDLKELKLLLTDMFDAAHVNKKRRDRILQKYIKDYDVNGDGLMSWEEFNLMFDKEDFVYIESNSGGNSRKSRKSTKSPSGSSPAASASALADSDLYSLNPFSGGHTPMANPTKSNPPAPASVIVPHTTTQQHSLPSSHSSDSKDLPQLHPVSSFERSPRNGFDAGMKPSGSLHGGHYQLGGTGLPSVSGHLPQLGPAGRQDAPEFFDVFIAYNPSNGRDLAQTLKLQMELHDPDLRVHLDVDDRTHSHKQQEIAASSANLLLFITEDVLAVTTVQRTLTSAFQAKKSIVLVHDAKSCAFPTDADIPAGAPHEFKQIVKQVLTLNMAIAYQRERVLRDAVVQEIVAKLTPRKGRSKAPRSGLLPSASGPQQQPSKLSAMPRRAIYSPIHSHPLTEFASVALLGQENRDYEHGYQCSVCATNFASGRVYHCRTCFYDVCPRDLK